MRTPVVEISSSDDEGETETQSRMSSSFKRPMFSDDDDEITVIDSFPCYEKKNSRPKRAKSFGTQIKDWENECLILEGDPDKVIADPGASTDESEDLVVTAEKGQVACRDFPHPRHLCVKFPFKNTPHEKYCDKCHCYVCDKPAPCLFWGKENPDKDHCHSSDKEEKWKKQRSFFKMRDCKEPPRALQHSFNTILSLTTMRTTVPVNRSNQASAGPGLPFQFNLNADPMRPSASTRSEQQRSFYPANSRNHTANKDVAPSCYINHASSQNPRVGRSGSRFVSSYRRDPSNVGLYGQGAFVGGSNGNRFSADSLQRQRNRLNTHLTNNKRPNSLDACSITQTQSINIHSSEQIPINDMLRKDVTCGQSPLIDDHDGISKLWDFLLGGDSEESNKIHNDAFSDLSLNISLNPSSSSSISNVTMQTNSSIQSSSPCVASNHELQLLPQSSVPVGVSNAADNVTQWPHYQNMPPSNATEQYPEHASYFNYDWLDENAYPHAVIEPWSQFGSEVTAMSQTWNYVAAQPSSKINDSGVSENIDHNPIRHDAETVVLTAQSQQQPDWAIPQVPLIDVSNTAGKMCSEQGFTASSTPDPALYVDLNNSWETLVMRQDLL